MIENNDFQTNENNASNNSTNWNELLNRLPDSQQESQENEPKKPKFEGYKTNTLLFHFLCIFGIVFTCVFFLFNIFLTPITVVGQSMQPTINNQTTSNNDTTHIDVVYYRAKDHYTYGDIVIISNETDHYIDNTNRSKRVNFLIKRIIACPGDTITFFLTDIDTTNHLYYYDIIVRNKNGEIVNLDESSYIKEQMFLYFDPHDPQTYTDFYKNIAPNIINDNITDPSRRTSTITIGENNYFVMGDNRNNSSDSRSFGPILESDICGNVRLQVNYGETIWNALFKALKSHLSANYIYLKENL